MLLWSLEVRCPGSAYSIQFEAETPTEAVQKLLAGGTIPHTFEADKTEHDGKFAAEDILHVIPMDGLDGIWLSQVGRSGTYVSVVLVNTVRGSSIDTAKDS